MSNRHAPLLFVLFLFACGGGVDPSGDGGEPSADAGSEQRPDAGPSDMCSPNPCLEAGRSVCVESVSGVRCECDPGLEEREGVCVSARTCEADTCSGHGDCSVAEPEPGGTPTLQCACELGFGGRFCESCDAEAGYYDDGTGRCTLDACFPNPCEESTRQRCEVVEERAQCLCNAGTHEDGGVCLADEECSLSTCAGHGVCSAADGATSCACESGWTGSACDACDGSMGYHADGVGGCTRDACLPNPCTAPLRSVCVDDGGATCACDLGAHLEGEACVADEVCQADTCSAHGACALVSGIARCTCSAGFAGDACEGCDVGFHDDGAGGCTTDVCLPNPCTAPLQGVCIPMGAAATCVCDPGAHPDGVGGCTTDPCIPDLCLAGNQSCRVVGDRAECFTPACDDGNACTEDLVAGGLCVHNDHPDGTSCSTDLCLAGETCGGGTCGGGAAVVCMDDNPCTRDQCNSATGCEFIDDDSLLPPDDGFACTVGTCLGGISSHTPTNSLCDDGLWCTGDEACTPGAGADARGCVTTNAPMAPAGGTSCAPYRCDDASDSFEQDFLTTGATCDDSIACTTSDICQPDGRCVGSISALCGPRTGPCDTTTAYGSGVDIGMARVTGTITQNGAELPSTTCNYENGVILARATDTGRLHRLRLIDWANGSYPNYTRSAASNTLNTTLIPGIYDILYQRAWQSSGEFVEEQQRSPCVDMVVNGYRVLQSNVLIPADGIVLNIDIRSTQITGTITQNGAELPLTTPNYENGVILARATDTGRLHRLRLINWANGSYPDYTRSAAANTLNTTLMPGTYDILYERAWQSGGEFVEEQQRSPYADMVVNGYRVVQENVVISGASQVLNIDIGSTQITGTITQNGAELPLTTPNYENGAILARATDTGRLHRLRLINWANGSYPDYTRSAAADTLNTTLMPGTYDILYERAWQSGGEFVEEQQHSPHTDMVVNGYRVVQENVVISGASQVLNIDIGSTQITGTITQNGGELPLTTPNYENGVILARATDTGRLHRLRLINWANGSYPNYTRSAAANTLNTTLMPGTYDILYERAWQSGGEFVEEQQHSPHTDMVVNGYRVVQENVVISGASQVLNIDIGSTQITGTITQNGGELPLTTPNYENGVILARATDTGRLHRLRLINWANGSYPNYTRSAAANTLNTTLIPGTYDILYERAWQNSGEFVEEQQRSPYADMVVNGYRVVQENVVISGASQVLNIDIGSTQVAGTITQNGAELPLTTSNYENGVILARATDTGRLHRLRLIDWANGSYPNYTRSALSNTLNTTLMPGTYDILYQRAWQSSAEYVEEQQRSPYPDPVVNGYRVIEACVRIE